MNIKKIIKITVALMILCSFIFPQKKKKLLKYSGNIGARYEANISKLNYLPENYAATYFNFNISAGLLALNLSGELSTSEKRFSPELIKKMCISPSIGWFHLDLGDHYPQYSKLVMSGAKVRGVSFLMDPGSFYFGMTGGRVRVGGADEDGEYRREAYGLQFGVKSKEFELISRVSRFNDLPSDIDSIYTPQESISAGLATKMVFFDKVRLQGEFGYSYHTRDKNAAIIDSNFSFQNINLGDLGLEPRLSSRVDYAYKYNIFIPIKPLQFSWHRDFIGPGFHTLGTPYMKNDILKDMFRVGMNLFKGKFYTNFIYLTQANNLNSEQTSETTMDSYSVSTRIRPVRFFSLSGRLTTLSREKDDSTNAFSYEKDSYSVTPELRFETGALKNRLSFTYGTSLSDYNKDEFETQNLRFRYTGGLDNGYSFFADFNKNIYENDDRTSYSLGASKKFQQNANISLSIGLGDKTESNLSGFIMLPWKFRLNTSISHFRLSRYSFRYQINIVRNF